MPYSVGASFKLDLPAAKAYSGRLMRAIMDGAGIVIEEDLKKMLSHPGTGREYPRQGGKGPPHTASAPKEPPAPDTGRLRNSISYEVASNGESVQIGSLQNVMINGAMVKYAAALEFGCTKEVEVRSHLRRIKVGREKKTVVVIAHSRKMHIEPRPFARPVALKYMGNNKLVDRVRSHLRKRGFGV